MTYPYTVGVPSVAADGPAPASPPVTPPTTGGDVVTGTGIVDQVLSAAQWADEMALRRAQLDADIKYNEDQIKAQMASIAASRANTATDAASRAAVAQIQAASQERIAALQAEIERARLALDKLNADRDYGLDVQRFGLQTAAQNWLERTSALEFQADAKRFGLEVAQFNSQQRQAQTQAKLQALELLASKAGPQDWVAYNNLLGGMSAPEASAKGEVDPFAFIGQQYQEFQDDGSLLNQANTLAQQAGQNAPSIPPIAGTAAVQAPAPSSLIPNSQTRSLLVGEQGPEIVQNMDRGDSLLRVIPNGQTRAIMGGGEMMRRAATGGEFSLSGQYQTPGQLSTAGDQWAQAYETQLAGTYGAGNPYRFQFAQYDPATLGNQPFIQKLRGTREATPFGGFGATLSNPSLGITNMPWAINYKTLLNMNPSEQKQAESLYSQGLNVDFNDVVEQSRRAAPIGARFGVAGYAGR